VQAGSRALLACRLCRAVRPVVGQRLAPDSFALWRWRCSDQLELEVGVAGVVGAAEARVDHMAAHGVGGHLATAIADQRVGEGRAG